MKNLETGKDKVKKICDILRRETIEPAKMEADAIVIAARQEADEIIADAHKSAKKMVEEAALDIERERGVFEASLAAACRQTLEALKEKIESKLFNPELSRMVTQAAQDPKLIARLIEAMVHAIEKEGTKADLSAVIAATVPARAVNELLSSHVIEKLKEKGVLLSAIGGGVEIKIHQQHITIDLSDETIQEIVAAYIRKDFRDFVFRG